MRNTVVDIKAVLLGLCLVSLAIAVNPAGAMAAEKELAIAVDEKGFNPSSVTVKKGEKVKLVFTRKTDQTCVKGILIPEFKINRDLPLNKPIPVEIQAEKNGEIGFSCAYKMINGKIKVAD